MMNETTTIGDTLTPEEHAELKRIADGHTILEANEIPTAQDEAAVLQGLGSVIERGKGKKHRQSSKSGPITPSEFRDMLNASQNISELLGNKRFAAGLFAFIRIETKVGDYQAALGEFISKYKVLAPEIQTAIRVRLSEGITVTDRKPVIEALKRNNKVTAVDELLMVLLHDDQDAWKQNANRSLVARKRADNWLKAYDKVWASEAESADEAERAEIQAKAKEGKATAKELARLQEPLIGQAPKAKAKRATTTDRMTPYSLLADMLLLIGNSALDDLGVGSKLSIEEQTV